MRFPLALALCQGWRGFQCHESTWSGGHFRAETGGAEAAQGWEEVGVPRGKGEAPSLETLLFLLAQFRAGDRVRGKAGWGLDTELPGADVPASLKMSLSTWICLRLSPVAQAGTYPYTG